MRKLLCLMGSGEITPNMVKVHRKIINDLSKSFEAHEKINAVSFATPYAFQENVQELSEKIVTYFNTSLNLDIRPVDMTDDSLTTDNLNANQDELARQAGNANFLFAGPGSPSYALSRWEKGQFSNILKEKLLKGGAIVFSSAAALTLGEYTVPVYEIYKVGAKPVWLMGLDILRILEIKAAIIPHYNNAEGGTHDTRYCYLGKRRLDILKSQMDQDATILGIDEHTAVIFDIDNKTFEVQGLGCFTVVTREGQEVYEAGYKGNLKSISTARYDNQLIRTISTISTVNPNETETESPFRTKFDSLNSEFGNLLGKGEYSKAGRLAALMLDEIKNQDILSDSDKSELSVSTLKSILLNIFDDFDKLQKDSAEQINSLVKSLSDIRNTARQESNFELADLIRLELTAINIQLSDSPSGTTWTVLKQ